ncbi:MAG: hypothetical protein ACOH1Y_11740 [Propionicimonas sp.]
MTQDVWTIVRSDLDPSVWVPNNHEDDMTCFLHASTSLRRLKVWIQKQENMDGLVWVQHGSSRWTLEPAQPSVVTPPQGDVDTADADAGA